MAIEVTTLGIYFAGIFTTSLVFNFISIHWMANLVLYEGSTRSKSLSISTEFALLTAILPVSALALAQIIDFNIFSVDKTTLYGSVAATALLLESFRVWYVKEFYDTIGLYALLIAEGLMIVLYLVSAVLSNTLLPLI